MSLDKLHAYTVLSCSDDTSICAEQLFAIVQSATHGVFHLSPADAKAVGDNAKEQFEQMYNLSSTSHAYKITIERVDLDEQIAQHKPATRN